MLPMDIRKRAFRKVAALAGIAVVIALLPFIGTTQVISSAQAADAQPVPVASGWNWTNYGPELKAVSCAQPNSCVAVGQGGAVLRSPGTGDVPLAWTMVDLKKDPQHPVNPVDLVGVTCSDDSCIAISAPLSETVTYGSWVYRSTDAGVTWTAITQLPKTGTLGTKFGSAIACSPDDSATVDTRNCYIVGNAGGVWRSTDDGRTWTGVTIPKATTPVSFDKVACASTANCVAVGGDDTPSSAMLQGNTVTLLATPIGIMQNFAALACDNPARCVATGGQGDYTILNIDATPSWSTALKFRRTPLPPVAKVISVSCPIVSVCIGINGDGSVLRTDALGVPGNFWRMLPVQPIISSLTCIQFYCIGVGKMAAWYASFDSGGIFNRINEIAKFDMAICPPSLSPTCVAGGGMDMGRSITGGTLWTLPIADRGALNTKEIRCQSSLACQIFGQTETLVTEDMSVFSPRYAPVQSAAGADAVDCVTDTLCVSPKESVVYTTFDGGKTMWSSNQMPKVRPTGITCLPGKTDPVTCFEATKYNILMGVMSRDATTGLPHWVWRYTNVDSDQIINAIACTADGTQCVAAGEQGKVLVTQPNDLMNWTELTLPVNTEVAILPSYLSATCPATGFCMIGGLQNKQSIVTSTVDNFKTYSYDKIGDIRNDPAIKGFACETLNRCVAVGSTVLVGVRNPPVTPPAK
ncbi:MAG: hypothetical protein Q7K25_08540 [Actinomycetota bacterium]|nr:hypothetical protein [Actinomycetota bacterium]